MKIVHTKNPIFNFNPITLSVTNLTGSIRCVMDSKAFESIGAFFRYAEKDFDCIVLLMGLKSFEALVNISSSNPDAEPVAVRYWGYKGKHYNNLQYYF